MSARSGMCLWSFKPTGTPFSDRYSYPAIAGALRRLAPHLTRRPSGRPCPDASCASGNHSNTQQRSVFTVSRVLHCRESATVGRLHSSTPQELKVLISGRGIQVAAGTKSLRSRTETPATWVQKPCEPASTDLKQWPDTHCKGWINCMNHGRLSH